MLQQETPDDFVLATGVMHSVRLGIIIITSKVAIEVQVNMTKFLPK